MITVQTVESKIIHANGSAATGFIVITPSQEFQYLDTADMQTKKVSNKSFQVTFSSGALSEAFTLAPTINAQQDKESLYYVAEYFTESGNWKDFWEVDANGANPIEITAITKLPDPDVQVSPTTFVAAADVTTVPAPNMIPRANENGVIDLGWFTAIPLNQMIFGYIGSSESFVIPSGAFALLSDTSDGQGKFWDGSAWNVLAGGTTNSALNSTTAVQISAYRGGLQPSPASGTLAIWMDTGSGQLNLWDGEGWHVITDGVQAPTWFVDTYEKVPLVGVLGDPLPNIPEQVLALGFDTGENQRRVYDGFTWHTFA